jgi:hypothetical protein
MFPHATPAIAALIVIPRLAVAVCAVGLVESITVTDTESVTAADGVPVIAPVELLIDNPLGRPLALYV